MWGAPEGGMREELRGRTHILAAPRTCYCSFPGCGALTLQSF